MKLRFLFPLLLIFAIAARAAKPALFEKSNLVAWCIVPFDSVKRDPAQRAEMVQKLGITKVAYDWRAEHVPQFEQEILEYQKRGIEFFAFWGAHEDAFKLFEKYKLQPQIWLTAPSPAAPTRDEQIQKAAAQLLPMVERARKLGCQLGLYNHGGWGGEPENLVAVCEFLRQHHDAKHVGIIYNQHHGHSHVDRFPEALAAMKPYLLCLNLDGMMRDGDQRGMKIQPLGQGELDLSLLKIIAASGYRGPIGIIGHTNDDVELRLRDNLEGLEWLVPQLDGKPAGPKPAARVPLLPKPAAPANGKADGASPNDKPTPRGQASLSPAFGNALSGGMLVEGKPVYHEFPITVECRAKLNSARGFNILVANDPKKSAEHWELYSFTGSGLFSIHQPGRGGSISADVNICDGQWHALAAVLETKRVRLYVDGKLVKDAPVKPLNGQAVAGGLAFGRLVEGGIGCDGVIDDVRISKGVREISAPSATPLQSDAQTLGLWNFEELAANAVSAGSSVSLAAKTSATPSIPQNVPDEWIIPAAKTEELTRANGWPKMDDFKRWDRSLGGPTSNRFSALTQITKQNVKDLKVAWEYHSKDGTANIQCNPIIVDGVMFAPTAGWNIVAIDAANGKELWRFSPPKEGRRLEDQPARRGLLYWPGDAQNPARVIFGAGNWLYALDPKTGKTLAGFGENGRTFIQMGTSTVGAVQRHVLVAAGYAGDVIGYDIRTGAVLWTFKTKPDAGDYGHETWSNIEQGANCWGGMALDESRGIAYVATGSPKPNYIGMGHTGDNLFSNCVIALDALTGKRLWHFQEIRHDVWDWDIPAPPNLVTVQRNGVKVDAVAQVTKLGNTLLLDRVTGAPLFDFRLVKMTGRVLPGDVPAPMQPMPKLPQPFARQAYTMAEMPSSPEAQAVVLPLVQRANSGPYPSIEEAKPTLLFNIHGGAEWTGASADPRNGRLYVTSNEIPWYVTCFRDSDPEPLTPPSEGEKVYQTVCFACHGADRKGIGHAPPLRGVRLRLTEEEIRKQLKNGKGSMPPMPQITEEQMKPLLDFILCRDRPIPPVDPNAKPKWTFAGWNRLVDHEGYPGCKPPWGTLTCLDLNTGKIAWQVPFGEYAELAARGTPKTGQESFGGCMSTASGLVIAGGTRDKKIRAFDADTGAELWSHQFPLHTTAPPASYEVDGRQFIVVPVTGGGKLGGPTGDSWVAFTLP